MFTLPSGVLEQIRSDVLNTMTDIVAIYSTSVSYNRYGDQIVSSGLIATVSGLMAAPKEKETELLRNLRSDGLLKQETIILLTPFGTSLTTDYVVVSSGAKEWDVVYTNNNSSDKYQLYVKAILTRDIVKSPYKDKTIRN